MKKHGTLRYVLFATLHQHATIGGQGTATQSRSRADTAIVSEPHNIRLASFAKKKCS
jgi:hypothetical protein